MLASSWPFDAHVVSKDVIEELQTLAVLNGDDVDDNLIMDRGAVRSFITLLYMRCALRAFGFSIFIFSSKF